jgi:hypothetical protein
MKEWIGYVSKTTWSGICFHFPPPSFKFKNIYDAILRTALRLSLLAFNRDLVAILNCGTTTSRNWANAWQFPISAERVAVYIEGVSVDQILRARARDANTKIDHQTYIIHHHPPWWFVTLIQRRSLRLKAVKLIL